MGRGGGNSLHKTPSEGRAETGQRARGQGGSATGVRSRRKTGFSSGWKGRPAAVMQGPVGRHEDCEGSEPEDGHDPSYFMGKTTLKVVWRTAWEGAGTEGEPDRSLWLCNRRWTAQGGGGDGGK